MILKVNIYYHFFPNYMQNVLKMNKRNFFSLINALLASFVLVVLIAKMKEVICVFQSGNMYNLSLSI